MRINMALTTEAGCFRPLAEQSGKLQTNLAQPLTPKRINKIVVRPFFARKEFAKSNCEFTRSAKFATLLLCRKAPARLPLCRPKRDVSP